MAEKYSSSPYERTLRICSLYKQDPDSCRSESCVYFHLCYKYIINNKCRRFKLHGKCPHSHSFFTLHNKRILEEQYRLSLDDENIFEALSDLIEYSRKTLEQSSSKTIHERDIDDSTSKQLKCSSSIKTKHHYHTQTSHEIKSKASIDSTNSTRLRSQSSDILSKKRSPATSHSTNFIDDEEDPPSSESHNEKDETTASSSNKKSKLKSVLSNLSGKKDKYTLTSNSNDSVANKTEIKYIFQEYNQNDQLAYLHGPVKRCLIEQRKYAITPSGYCQSLTSHEEKKIDKDIEELLPTQLKTERVNFDDNILALVSSTSAAEQLFEENQTNYAIISKAQTVSFKMEIIFPPKEKREQSMLTSTLSSKLSIASDKSTALLSDTRFHISHTNSSMDLIYGDITEIQVDVMVCVSTSITLLRSILARAGAQVNAEYNQHSQTKSTFFLDGGLTSARKILFIPWKLEVQSSDAFRTQQSLSELVQNCIMKADYEHFKSIAFPSIGTGQIGLDTQHVCEAMIDASNKTLQKCTMNVLFVLYPSKETKYNDKSYQVFRSYLDNLCKQSDSKKAGTASASHTSHSISIPVNKSQHIFRDLPCAQISIVSDSKDMTRYDKQLIKSLKDLMSAKEYDLSLVHKPFLNSDILIDICLDHNVIPIINYSKERLILHGDQDSCSQCFANLRRQRLVHRYYYTLKTKFKTEEIKLNTFVTLQIDEAKGNGESSILIRDDSQTTLDVDLRNLQVFINRSSQPHDLSKKEIDSTSE
ncbi:hypothetical protein I4U23_001263 [Adineta vaga]|nr:hypothetical protein I4U23_001263 [Adineta vaga]